MKSSLFKVSAMAIIVSLVMIGFNATQASAGAVDRFRPSSPTVGGDTEDELFTPLDFENAAASHPDLNSLFYISRCRFAPFSGDLNFYNSFSGNVADAITGDTLFSYADGTQCYSPQNESNIVINPANPNNIVTSANEGLRVDGHMVYSSIDGGKTWRNVVLPGWTRATGGKGLFARLDTCGDPVVAAGPDGTVYYSGLVCSENLVSFFSGIAVSSSHDGGLTWSAPVMVNYSNSLTIFDDKEWMTVGADGTVYLTWSRFFSPHGVWSGSYGKSPIVISTSTDQGKTWSSWAPVSDDAHPFDQGSQVVAAPDGSLYVAYEGASALHGYNSSALILAHSKDGGKTFTNTELTRVYDDLNCYPINIDQSRQTLSGEQFRINSFPSFAIDPSTGRMAIVWADDQANASCGYEKGGSFAGTTSNQVKLITSPDGTTWSSPRVITSGVADKVFPAVGANDGRIAVFYFTREYSPTTDECRAAELDSDTNQLTVGGGAICLDYAMRSSTDNFVSESRLTNQSSNPFITNAGDFIGDYTGAAVNASGQAYAAFTDFRGNPGITTPNMDIDVAFSQ